jgi:hypothetical protein
MKTTGNSLDSLSSRHPLYQFLRKRLFGCGASEASRQNYAKHILAVAKVALEQERSPAAMSDQKETIQITPMVEQKDLNSAEAETHGGTKTANQPKGNNYAFQSISPIFAAKI